MSHPGMPSPSEWVIQVACPDTPVDNSIVHILADGTAHVGDGGQIFKGALQDEYLLASASLGLGGIQVDDDSKLILTQSPTCCFSMDEDGFLSYNGDSEFGADPEVDGYTVHSGHTSGAYSIALRLVCADLL